MKLYIFYALNIYHHLKSLNRSCLSAFPAAVRFNTILLDIIWNSKLLYKTVCVK